MQISTFANLSGVKIDFKLNLKDHIGDICKKASARLNALTRVSGCINPDEKKVVMNASFSSQFAYCPSTWMFHNRELNHKISRLHERCFRVVYRGTTSSFEDNSV